MGDRDLYCEEGVLRKIKKPTVSGQNIYDFDNDIY